jgi:hypothetical protein
MKYFVNVFVAPDDAIECPAKTSGDTIELKETARMTVEELAIAIATALDLGDLATMDEEDLAMQPAANQVAAAATTVDALKEQFDALLVKLKAAGLMVADSPADPPTGG